MNIEAGKQYMETLKERYFKANKKEKGEMLNEYRRNAKRERKYAVKKFNRKARIKNKEERKKRSCFYDGNIIATLIEIWKIFDYPCWRRLEEILKTETENLRKWKEIDCSDETAEKLKKIKSAAIDRRLNREKEVLKLKEKYQKKSSFPLSNVPVKTGADFDRNVVGNEQVDFVESRGASASGEFVNNMSVCDMGSGWREGEAVMGKGRQRAISALDNIRKRMPFSWIEFHPDNGTNLLNFAVCAYAEKEKPEYSRSRPYHKNDNCFIEQKNSTRIRQVIGCLRYDAQEESDRLNDFYRNELRLYKNFFQPVIKLISKERTGGHIKRKYDRPKTPYRRLVESSQISEKEKELLTATRRSLNPAELKRVIDKKPDNLYGIYKDKKGQENINLTYKPIPSMVSFSKMSREAVSVS